HYVMTSLYTYFHHVRTLVLFCLYCSANLRVLHSFPTRRSSDLPDRPDAGTYPAQRCPARQTSRAVPHRGGRGGCRGMGSPNGARDRKSTRLNSSHLGISYAVFCLKKKNEQHIHKAQTRTYLILR